MRSLICPGCGRGFTAYESRRKFCSDACAKDAERARGRAAHAANMAAPKALCSFKGGCDKPVVNRGLCSGHNEQRRKGQELRPLRWTRGEGPSRKPKGPQGRICGNCSKPFIAVGRGSGRKKYCSETCAQDAKRAGSRDYQQAHRLLRPPCEFDGCDNPMSSYPLCAGHKAQERAGKALTPLRSCRPQAESVKIARTPKVVATARPATLRLSGRQEIFRFPGSSWLLVPGDRSRPRGTPCPFGDCGRPIYCRGLCSGHYKQAIDGRELTALQPQRRWHESPANCAFSKCGNLAHSMGLCMRHDAQRRKTTLTVNQYVAFGDWLEDRCSYCTEPLLGKFEIDHIHDGGCDGVHRDDYMCEVCIRGFVHRKCNEELKWLERAMSAGRITEPAPDVARYIAGRPFRERTWG